MRTNKTVGLDVAKLVSVTCWCVNMLHSLTQCTIDKLVQAVDKHSEGLAVPGAVLTSPQGYRACRASSKVNADRVFPHGQVSEAIKLKFTCPCQTLSSQLNAVR